MTEIVKPNWDDVSVTTPENWDRIYKLLAEKAIFIGSISTDQLKQLVNDNFDFVFNI